MKSTPSLLLLAFLSLTASAARAETYHVDDAGIAIGPPGSQTLTTLSTADTAWAPTMVIPFNENMWYSPPLTTSIAQGNWAFKLWTTTPACNVAIWVSLAITDSAGNVTALLGVSAVNVFANGPGIHESTWVFPNIAFQNLSNQRLRIGIRNSDAVPCPVSMGYNSGATYDSRLITPAFGPAGTATFTPPPTSTFTPTPIPAGLITKSVSSATASLSDLITYTLSWQNPSPPTGLNCQDRFESGSTTWPGGWQSVGNAAWGLSTDNGPTFGGTYALEALTLPGAPSFPFVTYTCPGQVVDGYLQADAKIMDAGGEITLLWRQNGSSTYQMHVEQGGAISLRVITNAAFNELATLATSIPLSAWRTYRFEVIGFQLRAYVNGTLVLSATDPNTTYAAGNAGLELDDDTGSGRTARFDNVTVATYGGDWYNVTLTDTLPNGLTYVSDTCGASVSGQVLSITLGTVEAATSGSCQIVARVAACPATLSNNALMASGLPPFAQTSNTVNTTVSCSTPTHTVTRSPTRTATRSPTRTPTPTPSPSASSTRTPTRTPTPSPTATPSPSATSSRTATPTRTASPSATSTPSPSATRSNSPTGTLTLTRSASPSATASASPTPTPSASPSPSATRSSSPTPTPTPSRTTTLTFTPSASATPTRSATPSATVTRSPSNTPSATPTPTATPSASSSATLTASPSASPSRTRSASPSATETATPTRTPTSTWTASPTASATGSGTMSATPTPPYTSAATGTGTPSPSATRSNSPMGTLTPSRTATPTATPSLASSSSPSATRSATATQTATASASPGASATVTWTPSPNITASATASATRSASPSPSASSSATPTRTPTPSSSPSPSAGPSFSPSPSPTGMVSFTASPSPAAMTVQLQVAAYNSAGERVRLLYSGASQSGAQGAWLSGPSFQAGETLDLLFPGALAGGASVLSWRGDNDQGQLVSAGVYYLRFETVDSFGVKSATAHAVTILNASPAGLLEIYNSAGELVAELSAPAGLGALNGARLLDRAVAPESGAVLRVQVTGKGGATAMLAWDGTSSAGLPVNSGTYTVQLRGAAGATQAFSFSVLKSAEAAPAALLRAFPNPVRGGPVVFSFAPGGSAQILIYNAAGELIARKSDPGGLGRAVLDFSGMASGIYVAALEMPGSAKKSSVKIALMK